MPVQPCIGLMSGPLDDHANVVGTTQLCEPASPVPDAPATPAARVPPLPTAPLPPLRPAPAPAPPEPNPDTAAPELSGDPTAPMAWLLGLALPQAASRQALPATDAARPANI